MKQTRRGFMGSAAAATLISACATTPIGKASNPDLEIFDAEAHSLLDIFARLEVLASGYTWSEGPVWDRARNCLYFTDVPENIAWKWSEASGATEFLAPSGVAREQATGFREPGANGSCLGMTIAFSTTFRVYRGGDTLHLGRSTDCAFWAFNGLYISGVQRPLILGIPLFPVS